MSGRIFFSSLFFTLLVSGFTRPAQAQGWTFTETVTQTGSCIPMPTLPAVVYYNQSACETARQQELAHNGEDWSVYGDGSCSTIVTCTPCTGSDAGSSGTGGSSGPGTAGVVNINGLLTGNPFFSPHPNMDIECWIEDIVQRLKSMGYPVNEGDINLLDFPLTGNVDFDKYYAEQVLRFKKPENGGLVYLKEGQNTIDPDDLKKSGSGQTAKNDNSGSLGTVMIPSSDEQWYHLDPLENGGIPPVPESKYDPNARYEHPKIELIREAAVTAAGWLPDGAAYPGIVAVNIWAEDAKAIQDIRDGNNPQDFSTSMKNALANSLTDIQSQALSDVMDSGTEKGLEIISGSKGFASLVSTGTDLNSKWEDLGGKVAGGEGDGIFGKISKAASWLGQGPTSGE
jgi:hypothetical protein